MQRRKDEKRKKKRVEKERRAPMAQEGKGRMETFFLFAT